MTEPQPTHRIGVRPSWLLLPNLGVQPAMTALCLWAAVNESAWMLLLAAVTGGLALFTYAVAWNWWRGGRELRLSGSRLEYPRLVRGGWGTVDLDRLVETRVDDQSVTLVGPDGGVSFHAFVVGSAAVRELAQELRRRG